MRAYCVLCGRPTMPFVMLGSEAVGPTCARRAGLTPGNAPKGGRLRFVHIKPVRGPRPTTLDLFADSGVA